jgi:DNA-binding HxlR family transcriptional regulator
VTGSVAPAQLVGRMAERDAWAAGIRCSIGRALDVVGTRSALLLMREAYYGTTRFDDFAKRVGVTEAVAATRLKELVEAGLLVRRPYREPGQRTRYEYVLTSMGGDLVPAALALMQWGDTYLTGSAGAPIALRHAGCDAPVRVEVRCDEGHRVSLDELNVSFNRDGAVAARRPAAEGSRGTASDLGA